MADAGLEAILRTHHVFVATDDPFQRRARLLQALWRETRGLPIGSKPSGEPLGSRLLLSFARDSLANLMSGGARAAARAEVDGAGDGAGKLIEEDRLFANLLSSQPLCFNLFGELQADLALAGRVFRELYPERIGEVTAVRFEHSPGRGDPRYTGDRSAFDVFVEHTTPVGARGFVGIEVKYHEALNDPAAAHKPRYTELADAMGCFAQEHRTALQAKPLQQIWRDHLLAGAMLASGDGWDTGLYVFLHAAGNTRCVRAAARYAECLTDARTFAPLTLERFIEILQRHASGTWVTELEDRYLGWSKIEALERPMTSA
jgi:hypothetical protein